MMREGRNAATKKEIAQNRSFFFMLTHLDFLVQHNHWGEVHSITKSRLLSRVSWKQFLHSPSIELGSMMTIRRTLNINPLICISHFRSPARMKCLMCGLTLMANK